MSQTPEQQQQMSSEQLANYYAQYVQYHSYMQQWQQHAPQPSYDQYSYYRQYPHYYPGHGMLPPHAGHMPPGYPMAAWGPYAPHHGHFPAAIPPPIAPVDEGARLIREFLSFLQ